MLGRTEYEKYSRMGDLTSTIDKAFTGLPFGVCPQVFGDVEKDIVYAFPSNNGYGYQGIVHVYLKNSRSFFSILTRGVPIYSTVVTFIGFDPKSEIHKELTDILSDNDFRSS